jgi:hypothetical protein
VVHRLRRAHVRPPGAVPNTSVPTCGQLVQIGPDCPVDTCSSNCTELPQAYKPKRFSVPLMPWIPAGSIILNVSPDVQSARSALLLYVPTPRAALVACAAQAHRFVCPLCCMRPPQAHKHLHHRPREPLLAAAHVCCNVFPRPQVSCPARLPRRCSSSARSPAPHPRADLAACPTSSGVRIWNISSSPRRRAAVLACRKAASAPAARCQRACGLFEPAAASAHDLGCTPLGVLITTANQLQPVTAIVVHRPPADASTSV